MGPDEIEFANLFDLIDDLIDFPPENECDGDVVGSSDGKDLHEALPGCDTFSSGGLVDTASDLSAELAVPYEDIVQLEWLSTFMEESFSDRSPTLDGYLGRTNQFHTSSPVSVLESSSTSSSTSKTGPPLSPNNHCSPQRARSKRPHPPTSTPRHLISSVGPTPHTPFRAHWGFLEPDNVAESPPAKKARKPITDNDHASKRSKIAWPEDGPVRKCLHCEITKTPQWRAGPMGPKTLCNACGVRYKSGRLFPEYRPAASPTFIPALHSNSHRKVVEMRGKAGNRMPEGSEVAEIATG